MKTENKIFIFGLTNQSYKTAPQFICNDCIVLKEIESPDGIKVHTELWQVKTLCVFSILSGLFVFNWTKYTSRIVRVLVQVSISFLNKRIRSMIERSRHLLSETETKTANDMTARKRLNGVHKLSLFPKGGDRGGRVTSLPHFSASLILACNSPLIVQ